MKREDCLYGAMICMCYLTFGWLLKEEKNAKLKKTH